MNATRMMKKKTYLSAKCLFLCDIDLSSFIFDFYKFTTQF